MNFKMRKIWWCLFIISCSGIMESLATIKNVRLVDHTSYAVSIIQQTMSKVEERCWCNLKIDDLHFDISENVLTNGISAEIDLKDGFVVSIQKIDIISSTIQQVFMPLSGNTTMVDVRSTVRMVDVSMGFDVTTKMDNKISHSTGLILYPLLEFRFTITKHLFTDEITVNVVGAPARTTNLMHFMPENDITKVFTVLFNWNSTAPSIERWANNIFRPVTLELATKEIEFPRICYDCTI